MSSRATRRTLRPRTSTVPSLRPRIDHLESRLLLATSPLMAYPTYDMAP